MILRTTQIESIITGREASFLSNDLLTNSNSLLHFYEGKRLAIVGAAGSIGSAVVKALLPYRPKLLAFFDLSENNLVELVRESRSMPGDVNLPEFNANPIGLGSLEFYRYFKETKPFDYFLNLAAMKHVRSEKNVYSLIRMIDTNVLFPYDFLNKIPYDFTKVFSVSSDKAANPANAMGATKMAMEQVLMAIADRHPFSTARFANVAFSDGSLPYGFLKRLEKRQPLAAPSDVRRYFISHQEAGELCVLSASLGENCDVFFPKLGQEKDEKTFSWIAERLLERVGYEPCPCDSEEEARRKVEELLPKKRWPCYFFPTDTSGEKDFEEFFTESETLDLNRFDNVGVIKRSPEYDKDALDDFLAFFRHAKTDSRVGKNEYFHQLQKLVPTLDHIEKGKNLDQKM